MSYKKPPKQERNGGQIKFDWRWHSTNRIYESRRTL